MTPYWKRARCFSCSWVRYSFSWIRRRPCWPGGKGRSSKFLSPPTRSILRRRDFLVIGPVYRAMFLVLSLAQAGSDATALGRADTVVRRGRDVADRADLEAGGGERTDRRLAARTRALDEDVDLAHAVLHGAAGSSLGSHLGGERGGLARALEADLAGGGPGDHGARGVRDRDDRVVERALDVSVPVGDVLLLLATNLRHTSLGRHFSPTSELNVGET